MYGSENETYTGLCKTNILMPVPYDFIQTEVLN